MSWLWKLWQLITLQHLEPTAGTFVPPEWSQTSPERPGLYWYWPGNPNQRAVVMLVKPVGPQGSGLIPPHGLGAVPAAYPSPVASSVDWMEGWWAPCVGEFLVPPLPTTGNAYRDQSPTGRAVKPAAVSGRHLPVRGH